MYIDLLAIVLSLYIPQFHATKNIILYIKIEMIKISIFNCHDDNISSILAGNKL